MIDSLRFKIYIDEETKQIISDKSVEKKEVKPKPSYISDLDDFQETDERKRSFYAKPFILETSYQLYVTIYKGNLYIEFSAPKALWGSNIYMLYPDRLLTCLERVKVTVESYFNVKLPPLIEWIVQRLDICYAWRLPSQELAEKAIITLSSYDFPRKKKNIIANESVVYHGNPCKVKFYLKQPEYKAHSMGKLKKWTYAYTNAHKMLDACTGILRFEVSMKKKQIKQDFGLDDINYTHLTYEAIENLLRSYLSRLVKSNNFKTIDITEVYPLLEEKYGKKQAMNLFQFFCTWFSEDKTREKLNRFLLDNNMCSSTINKRLDLLKNANVGIITTDKELTFDLSIPSDIAVNSPYHNVMELLPKFDKPKPKHGEVKD